FSILAVGRLRETFRLADPARSKSSPDAISILALGLTTPTEQPLASRASAMHAIHPCRSMVPTSSSARESEFPATSQIANWISPSLNRNFSTHQTAADCLRVIFQSSASFLV